jgi:hypothetical protein
MGTMMTVTGLIEALMATFPRAPIKAWAEIYRVALSGFEGERLAEAYRLTMAGWAEPGCPKPAHFAANVPNSAVAVGGVDRSEKARQWAYDDETARLAAERADTSPAALARRAELDRLYRAAMAHLSVAAPAGRYRSATIFKPISDEALAAIRKGAGQ